MNVVCRDLLEKLLDYPENSKELLDMYNYELSLHRITGVFTELLDLLFVTMSNE